MARGVTRSGWQRASARKQEAAGYGLHDIFCSMQRDFKIGLVSGMVVAIGAMLYLATHPALSLRRLRPSNVVSEASNQIDSAAQSPETSLPARLPERAVEDPNVFDWTRYEREENRNTERFHIVEKGQTLSDIAQQRYGSAAKWPKIYNANKSTVKNPNSVRPGTKLIIPD